MTAWSDPRAQAARASLGADWDGVEVAAVLGSGLGGAVKELPIRGEVDYASVPGLGRCGAPGHAGRLIRTAVAGRGLAVFQGRRHVYEGLSMAEAGFPARLAKVLGARLLVLFSAVGGVSEPAAVGSWVFITDHINLMGRNPLEGVGTRDGPAFVDLTRTYRADLWEPLRERCSHLGVRLAPGVLAAFPGPTYETPAEVRMARTLGATAAGMSAVPEAVWARFLGLDVVAFGRVTNAAAGLAEGPIDHAEVLRRCAEGEREAAVLLEETVVLWGEARVPLPSSR